ncbi:MAG: peptidylprolyl isomerase [Saprospiraceae bacterium]|nr:peptidylprolyl isomerase [Saprospiraceae bacterium]MCB0681524.1 peptidylprolyl isomerase [Saprospiraceae bacterium]
MNVKLLLPIGLVLLLGACVKEPQADFSLEAPSQAAPVKVQCINQSINADSYAWDFGDGHTSTEENPAHEYRKFGEMMVVLRAYKDQEVSVDSMLINIPEPPRRHAVIETNYGNIQIELSNRTPLHRDNFIKLAEQSFYDSLLFHRVIQGFMIQGGDPLSRNAEPGEALGAGDPGYTIPAEFDEALVHVRGALATARTGDQVNPQKASSGSQFYIVQGQPVSASMLSQLQQYKGRTYSPEQVAAYSQNGGAPMLDWDYTVFGHVVEGLDVVDKIAAVAVDPNARPLEDVRMRVRMLD